MRKGTFLKAFILLLLMLPFFSARAQQLCENFNNSSTGNWQVNAANLSISNANPADGTRYLLIEDGASNQSASTVFNTNYNTATVGCGSICFDYKVFEDGQNDLPAQLTNTIRISTPAGNNQFTATFRLNTPITENSAWTNICVPFGLIGPGMPLPSNAQGSWVMLNGANTDWNTLVSNFDRVIFIVDVAGSSSQSEDIGIDNFCINRASCCDVFNTPNAFGNWQVTGSSMSITDWPPAANNTTYLRVLDDQGNSVLFNTGYNATSVGCGNICFDYKIFSDAIADVAAPVVNTIKISANVNGTPLSAVFRLNTPITENSPWMNICVPLSFGSVPPGNAQGSWVMVQGTNAQWNTLLRNYTQVSFNIDVAGSSLQLEMIGIDNFCVVPGNCCDPYPSSLFTLQRICNNGVVNVTVTANDTYTGTSHWWGLMETSVCGTTSDANTVDGNPSTPAILDPVAPVQGGTTASFTITDLNKCYYIKHGVWQDSCFTWIETRLPVQPYKLVNNFRLEDEGGTLKTQFCYGENVYLNGTFSSGEDSYYIDVWRKPIGNPGPFQWYKGPGWFTGQVGVVNLSQLVAGLNPPGYFEPGYEYQVKLALANVPGCIGWTERLRNFTVVCCDGFLDGCFRIDPDWAEDSYSLKIVNFNTYANAGVQHEWYVFSSPNYGAGPYTHLATVHSTTEYPVVVYNAALPNIHYTVIHKMKTPCGDICVKVVQYTGKDGKREIKGFETDGCEKVDCSLVDTLLNRCPVPINLVSDCEKQALRWDAVTGAQGYLVEISYNDPNCCRTNRQPTGAIYSVSTNYLELKNIITPAFDCLRWRVATKCYDAVSPWSQWQCYNCKDHSAGKQIMVKGEEPAKAVPEPVVAPNPNNGTMSLYLEAAGEVKVTVEVYNTYGRLIHSVKQRSVPGGRFSETLTLASAYKGMYTIVFKTNYGTFNKKVIVQ